jgi:hypothetical protein
MHELTVVDFCVFSQRLNATRLQAWDAWKQYGQEGVGWQAFCRAWKAAQASEELASRYPGLRQQGPS